MMNRLHQILRGTAAVVMAAGLPLAFGQSAAQLVQGEKDTIFIAPVKVTAGAAEMAKSTGTDTNLNLVVDSLQTQFISALNGTGVFQLVERQRKGDLELEQSFAAVAADPNDKNAAQAGKMAGAKYAFLPQVDGFEDIAGEQHFTQVDRKNVSRQRMLSAVVQIVDTTSGKLLPDSPTAKLHVAESAAFVPTNSQGLVSNEALIDLAKAVANQLCFAAVAQLRPAKVLAVTGAQVMINRGANAGFTPGARVEFYGVQTVKDDDTGEVFRNEVPVGQGVVVRGDPRQSYARIDGENLGIAKGCVARVVFGQAAPGGAAPAGAAAPMPGAAPAQPATPDGLPPGSSEKPLKF